MCQVNGGQSTFIPDRFKHVLHVIVLIILISGDSEYTAVELLLELTIHEPCVVVGKRPYCQRRNQSTGTRVAQHGP